MTLLFKISGFALVIFTTSAIGFYKANELALRYKRLCDLHKCITTLKECIRLHGGEIDSLLQKSFSEFPINTAHLKKSDTKLLDEFFSTLGSGDTSIEYERCELYINLLKRQSQEAYEQYRELARLYKNIGVLSGVLICIFFL